MEQEQDHENNTPTSPFWIQTTTNITRIQRYQRYLSSLFFNSVVLIIFLLVFALLSMIFIVPKFIDFSSKFSFKPNLVKRSWDSINLLLVLIALLFGFLTRNVNNDETILDQPEFSPGTPAMYDDLRDETMSSAFGLRRQRTSYSYPDLRELSPPWNHRAGDPWRFSDDTHLNYYRALESNKHYPRLRKTSSEIQGNLYFPAAEQLPEMTSLPPQTPVVKKKKRVGCIVGNDDGERNGGPSVRKMVLPENESTELKGRRGERKRGNGEKRRARSSEPRRILSPVIDPVAAPSSPPQVSSLSDRKRNGGGNGAKDFFTSFYNKKKNKLHRGRSVDNLSALSYHSESRTVKFQLLPPSVPPQRTISDNLFSLKKEKQKKIKSVAQAPPAPPPLPPTRATITRVAPFVTDKPRVPMMLSSFTSIDDSSSGGDSPMKQIPPPPPLPPFKMSDWKFAVEGDFVRLQSTLSSRSASPDGDEAQSPSSDLEMATGLAPSPFGPSPDVDNEADNFIARFRAGLKLERVSKLGPGSGPSDS